MSMQTMSLSSGLGNAAYAVGTVLAVQFAQHLPQRRMLVVYAVFLVIGSVLAASAQNVGDVHRRPCDPGPLHQPAADRRCAAPGDRLSGEQAARHRRDHEHVHLRGGGARPVHRRRCRRRRMPGDRLFWIVAGISVVALVLARADLRGRAARQSRLAARPAGDRAGSRRLRRRLLRRLAAHEPLVLGCRW